MNTRSRLFGDIATGVVLFIITGVGRGLFAQAGLRDTLGIISDSFVIPGAILIGFALLSYISQTGVFDMLTYSVRSLVKTDNNEDFYAYRCRKKEKRTQSHGTLFLGISFVIIGMIFLSLYLII